MRIVGSGKGEVLRNFFLILECEFFVGPIKNGLRS